MLNRKVINDPKLQFGITGFFVLLGFLNFAFFSIILRVYESRIMRELVGLDPVTSKYLQSVIGEISNTVFIAATFFGLFVLIFSFFAGILLLQHISGPSYALKRFLGDLLEDKKPRYPLKLRKYDFFSNQADLANKLYEKYELNDKKSIEK